MAFSDIPEVKNSDFFLDVAFSRAKKIIVQEKSDPFNRQKTLLLSQIDSISDTLSEHMGMITKNFPNIDSLDEFYEKLLKATVEYVALKKSLGAVAWAQMKVREFSKVYRAKAKNAADNKALMRCKKEYYGRISSFIKQIDSSLSLLNAARMKFRDYPSIKTGLFTVCISGFPNVGKSTLLSKITTARPEIKEYAFTTKKLNLGYSTTAHYEKMQVVDTPGTLNRFSVMNSIEKQAYLALRYLADVIVFIFDLTEEYDLIDQYKLFDNTIKNGKPIMVYLSKTDIIEPEIVERFREEFERKYHKNAYSKDPINVIDGHDELKKQLLLLMKLWKKHEIA